LFLFWTPFLKINGHPFLLLNVIERRFIILGFAFGPQDFYLFVLATITIVIFVVLFTAIYGRIFCGWICPQTVFLEMVYRKIEYWIEGDSANQRALDKAPMDSKKFFKKTSKHLIFYGIAFLIGNTLIAYIVGIDKLFEIISHSPTQNLSGFISVIVFSILFYKFIYPKKKLSYL